MSELGGGERKDMSKPALKSRLTQRQSGYVIIVGLKASFGGEFFRTEAINDVSIHANA